MTEMHVGQSRASTGTGVPPYPSPGLAPPSRRSRIPLLSPDLSHKMQEARSGPSAKESPEPGYRPSQIGEIIMSAQPVPEHENVVPIRPGQPETGHPWDRPAQRRPVLPGWVREKQSRGHAARWASRHVGHHVAFHGVRVPKYLLRTLACAPRGLLLAVWHGWRWVFDRDDAGTHQLRVDAAARKDHKAYAAAARIRKDRVRTRLLAIAVSAAVLAILAVIVRLAWPPGLWLLAAAAVGGLAYLGNRA